MGEWQHGLCGCFDNTMLCIITYFVPCLTAGKNAEALGKNCLVWGCLSMIAPCTIGMVRKEIREQKGIEGSFVVDLLLGCCLSQCVIVQCAQEMGGGAQAQSIDRA